MKAKKDRISLYGHKPWINPPEIFEKQTGFTGISGNWRLPFTITEQRQWMMWNEQDIYEMWMILVRHNPSLSELPPVTESDGLLVLGYSDHLMGVLSQFNLNDIKFFLNPYRELHRGGNPKNEEIKRLTGHRPGWVLSDQTYDLIMAQVPVSRTGRLPDNAPNLQYMPIRTPEGAKLRDAMLNYIDPGANT